MSEVRKLINKFRTEITRVLAMADPETDTGDWELDNVSIKDVNILLNTLDAQAQERHEIFPAFTCTSDVNQYCVEIESGHALTVFRDGKIVGTVPDTMVEKPFATTMVELFTLFQDKSDNTRAPKMEVTTDANGSVVTLPDGHELVIMNSGIILGKTPHEDVSSLFTNVKELFAGPPVAPIPDGWSLVPHVPAEEQWNGLGRSIMSWMDFGDGRTPATLVKHLKATGKSIPDWLTHDVEMTNMDHTPSKGTRCMLIYRAMVEDLKTSPPLALSGPKIAFEKKAKGDWKMLYAPIDPGEMTAVINYFNRTKAWNSEQLAETIISFIYSHYRNEAYLDDIEKSLNGTPDVNQPVMTKEVTREDFGEPGVAGDLSHIAFMRHSDRTISASSNEILSVLLSKLRVARRNIVETRQSGMTGHLAGWEHNAIDEAIGIIKPLQMQSEIREMKG